MSMKKVLSVDPYNVIITGVGGQGNVLASRLLGRMLTRRGLNVTIGETFGASQRGGSVMSHLRISENGAWSPQIPAHKANVVVSLEPVEALRVLAAYGNPSTEVIWNTRPVYPVSVISGDARYPGRDQLSKALGELCARHYPLNATDEALTFGNPIFGNIIMIGALSAVTELPVLREDFAAAIAETFPPDKVGINLRAFDLGASQILGAG